MRSQKLYALLLLLLSAACHYTVLGNERDGLDNKNETYSGDSGYSFSGDNGAGGSLGTELPVVNEDEEDAESAGELTSSGYLPLDDSLKVQPVVKPKKQKERKKTVTNSGKDRKRQPRKKKVDPCETVPAYKDFCIHGECKYLENLQQFTCKCLPGYMGERCGVQLMKAGSPAEETDTSATALAILAFVLSAISFIAIIIAITVRVGKKNPATYEGETEEQEKLQQHSGVSV